MVPVRAQVFFAYLLLNAMRTAVLCALLGLVCFASAARDMAPAPAPAPGMPSVNLVEIRSTVLSEVHDIARLQVLLPCWLLW